MNWRLLILILFFVGCADLRYSNQQEGEGPHRGMMFKEKDLLVEVVPFRQGIKLYLYDQKKFEVLKPSELRLENGYFSSLRNKANYSLKFLKTQSTVAAFGNFRQDKFYRIHFKIIYRDLEQVVNLKFRYSI